MRKPSKVGIRWLYDSARDERPRPRGHQRPEGVPLEGGAAILVGSADARNVPDAARAWGTTVGDDSGSLRVLLPTDATTLWANLQATGRIAVCYTDVSTYRSVQIKGRVTGLPGRATPGDLAVWERYQHLFFLAVEHGSMTPRSLVSRLLPSAVRPTVIEVDELFDQTPGPVAGTALGAGIP